MSRNLLEFAAVKDGGFILGLDQRTQVLNDTIQLRLKCTLNSVRSRHNNATGQLARVDR